MVLLNEINEKWFQFWKRFPHDPDVEWTGWKPEMQTLDLRGQVFKVLPGGRKKAFYASYPGGEGVVVVAGTPLDVAQRQAQEFISCRDARDDGVLWREAFMQLVFEDLTTRLKAVEVQMDA